MAAPALRRTRSSGPWTQRPLLEPVLSGCLRAVPYWVRPGGLCSSRCCRAAFGLCRTGPGPAASAPAGPVGRPALAVMGPAPASLLPPGRSAAPRNKAAPCWPRPRLPCWPRTWASVLRLGRAAPAPAAPVLNPAGVLRRQAFARGVAGNTALLAWVLWGERLAAGERFTRVTHCTRGVARRTGYHAEGRGSVACLSPTAL
jgi:hypothetical protein